MLQHPRLLVEEGSVVLPELSLQLRDCKVPLLQREEPLVVAVEAEVLPEEEEAKPVAEAKSVAVAEDVAVVPSQTNPLLPLPILMPNLKLIQTKPLSNLYCLLIRGKRSLCLRYAA